MTAARRARTGIPIVVKLVVAASIIVALVTGVVTAVAEHELDAITEDQIALRRQAGEEAIQRTSQLLVSAVATAIKLPLSTSAYSEIKPILDAALADDRAQRDSRLLWLAVYDRDAVIARTASAPDGVPELSSARPGLDGQELVFGEYIREGGGVLGTLRIGVSTAGLHRALEDALAGSRAQARRARNRALIVALVVLIAGVVLAAIQGAQLARPIAQLTTQAERIASGDLLARVPEDRRDELGVLARTFNAMSERIRALLDEQAAKAALDKELALAQQIQRAMVPGATLDRHGAIRLIGHCAPASQCGGDWWWYRKLRDGRVLVVIGDATGHGVHSAMIAATARGAVEALASMDEQLLTPARALRGIDAAIRHLGEHDVMMTAFAVMLDPHTATAHYANAGHNAPYLVAHDPARRTPPRVLPTAGNPLGDRQITTSIDLGELGLVAGDALVMFTDGLIDRLAPGGGRYGERRLRTVLAATTLGTDTAVIGLRDRVVSEVEKFADGVAADDDETLVVCQYAPPLGGAPERPSRRSLT